MKLFSGQLMVYENVLRNVGDEVTAHRHDFPHTAIVIAGGVRVVLAPGELGEQTLDLKAGSYFEVPAGVEHQVVATAPDTVTWCVFVPRDPKSHEITPVYNGWLGAAQ